MIIHNIYFLREIRKKKHISLSDYSYSIELRSPCPGQVNYSLEIGYVGQVGHGISTALR